jgi:hypothetical protein
MWDLNSSRWGRWTMFWVMAPRQIPAFRRNILSPSSGLKPRRKTSSSLLSVCVAVSLLAHCWRRSSSYWSVSGSDVMGEEGRRGVEVSRCTTQQPPRALSPHPPSPNTPSLPLSYWWSIKVSDPPHQWGLWMEVQLHWCKLSACSNTGD